MLEEDALLIYPWSICAGPCNRPELITPCKTPIRPILQPGSLVQLGLAFWTDDQVPLWRRWLAAPRLTVCETDDISLVFSLCSSWGSRHRRAVLDAENKRVGTVRFLPRQVQGAVRGFLQDARGQVFARLEAGRTADEPTRFIGLEGKLLGTIEPAAEGMLLSFATVLQGSPFVRMLLLAALLQQTTEVRAKLLQKQ